MPKKQKTQKPTKYDDDVRKLVMERIKASSDDLMVSIGSDGEYSKEQLLESIAQGDELGNKIIDIQMEYLRDMASGLLYNTSNE